MKITVLIDNTRDKACSLECEHGLSIYFEKDGKKYLYDTGASSLFIENAKTLGIVIADIDTLILSHAHDDHTGGLQAFMAENKKANIYLSDKALVTRCFSFSSGTQKEISIDFHCIDNAPDRFYYISETCDIAPGITTLCCTKNNYPCPKGNTVMMQSDLQGKSLSNDKFSHEIALAISESNTQTILSACSHKGILNIIESAKSLYPEVPIKTFIGGLHFPNAKPHQELEQDADFKLLAKQLNMLTPDIRIITGHCTGSNAITTLSKYINIETFHSGFTI